MTLAASTAFGRAVIARSATPTRTRSATIWRAATRRCRAFPTTRSSRRWTHHPPTVPVGGALTVNWVGRFVDTVSGFGSVPGRNYAIVDLSGRVFLDGSRRHRINLRLENLFDEAYTTLHGGGVTDDTATPYVVRNLGTPLTLHVS